MIGAAPGRTIRGPSIGLAAPIRPRSPNPASPEPCAGWRNLRASWRKDFTDKGPSETEGIPKHHGVGAGRKPPMFLKPGNVMRLGITGLGEQRQEVVAYPG